jgi:hypothetical protein
MKFKCKLSGVVIELIHEVDIKTTLENENYEPVVEPVKEEKPKVVKPVTKSEE